MGWIGTLRTFWQNAPIAYWLVNSRGAFMKMYSVSTQESLDQWTMERPARWLQLAWKSDGGLLCCHRGRLEREDKRSPEATGEVEVTLYLQYSGDSESLSWTEKNRSWTFTTRAGHTLCTASIEKWNKRHDLHATNFNMQVIAIRFNGGRVNTVWSKGLA